MFFQPISHLRFLALFLSLMMPAFGQTPDAKAQEKKRQPHVRFVCVAALEENQEIILAARDEEGGWRELGSVQVRSSYITPWIPAQPGELHLTLREGATLKSIGVLTNPAGSRRSLAVLIPDPGKGSYSALVVDPEKIGLAKGKVLAVNFSKQKGLLLLGTNKLSVSPGQHAVAEPTLEANGMYRLMVAYEDDNKQAVACYDRYLHGSAESRDMLFMFPDPQSGMKIISLPMFGELD